MHFGTLVANLKATQKKLQTQTTKLITNKNKHTMKKLVVLLTGLFLVTFAVQNLNAQNTATETGDAFARIIKIIEITKDQDLHFGDIVPSSTAGSVEVTAAATASRTPSGGVTLLNQFTTHQSAKFTVKGEGNANYSITLPADNAVPLTLTGSSSMYLTGFSHNAGANPKIDGSGESEVYVGATLEVNADQDPGLYTGTFDVTVDYQ